MGKGSDTTFLPAREIAVTGDFRSGEGAIATDISGIASAAGLGRRRRKCLVVDNEGLFAQFAQFDLEAGTLAPGAVVPLLPSDRNAIQAVGRAPDDGDPGPDRYILDGEGVAWLAPHYYITGSHSIHDWKTPAGEKRADYRRSAFLVARVGRNGQRPELSYRLNELLSTRKTFAPYFLKSPDQLDGINVEAIAAGRRRLFFGFRSPVINGEALILSVRAAALFTSGADLAAKTIRVPLGRNIGIRDLTVLPDGRFLILAGPRPDGGKGFTLQLFDRRTGKVRRLGRLAPHGASKPEAMLLASYRQDPAGSAVAEVLLLSDGPGNGAPRLYTLAVPP